LSRGLRLALVILLVCTFWPGVALAQAASTATPTIVPRVQIISPAPGMQLGGVVSIIGTVQAPDLVSFSLAFGPGDDPGQWIPIGEERREMVVRGRLAFWDTTKIPDGLYTLRLRMVHGGKTVQYTDYYVGNLLVANAPRTLTPWPTLPPTATPTATATPTPTLTPGPTLALQDNVSPFLYLNQMDQLDPLCKNWRQRYSIWVSNVGMITVTHVLITDTLPVGMRPVLEDSTPGAQYDGDRRVTWALATLGPGQAAKFELAVEVLSWLETGQWLTNLVVVTADQVPQLWSSEGSLYSECPHLKLTATARPLILPTVQAAPSATPTRTRTPTPRPSAWPTSTPLAFSVSPEGVSKSLDLLTIIIIAVLAILVVVTIVLVYRQIAHRR
jgi:hypothetical protein